MSYVSVPKEEHDSPDAEQLAIKTRDPSGRLCDINIVLALVAVSLCFGMGVFMFFDLAYDQMKPAETTSAPQFQFNCGSSTSEARAAGCRFDSTTFTWVPPACFGEPLMEEFLGSKNWTWSLDDFAREGDFESLYTTMDYHVTHCAYAWKKLHRSLFSGDLSHIDGYTASTASTSAIIGEISWLW
ncbi:hypothetical protein AO1008_05414 [Aspergillus oryzae 100-8]|uniref:Uncharacterized protein n=1 Tax=Aspergillus oryzae (strain 3.042) TaxID=1160506 RepID=I8A956_ASPO3|nr:hypothetical protein Ao3042_01696 [Aspergillus oryzae 3.042]KDE79361.1 hypothetical protein AO1008_05414 [Aspergillus oryzae 100-8]|eukprot:EIT81792.1 hypothetical protein Ao3042_01696 [Aspergillus oryzae 3.042]